MRTLTSHEISLIAGGLGAAGRYNFSDIVTNSAMGAFIGWFIFNDPIIGALVGASYTVLLISAQIGDAYVFNEQGALQADANVRDAGLK